MHDDYESIVESRLKSRANEFAKDPHSVAWGRGQDDSNEGQANNVPGGGEW